MTDSDRSNFDYALDALAKVLRLTPLENDVKFGYFKALRHFPIASFIDGCQRLTETYRPKRKDDFPVPAVLAEAIGGAVAPETYDSRTYDEIVDSYRRRGILIGEEARERLEAEIAARKQDADESWQAVSHRIIGEDPF